MDAPPFPAAALAAARDAAKAHLRVVGDDEDALIERLAATALALCEAFTGTAVIARDFVQLLDGSARWQRLGAEPVTAIEGVADAGGTPLAPAAYAIDIDARATGWVRAAARMRVGYRAGAAAEWSDLPPPIAQGVVLLVAHLFDHRERAGAAPPAVVSALWRPWRRMRLAAGERAA